MPLITPDQLPQEIQDLLGRSSDPFAAISDQPVCSPDSRVTAQSIGEVHPRIRPAYIRNAKKGDLIMCPGGSEGVVGALLYALQPPQLYSHMGIMIRDYTEIRHATFSEERLKKFPTNISTPDDGILHPDEGFFRSNLEDDTPPTDGFQELALRFGWPGTISQTVHVCWLNWHFGGFNLSALNGTGLRVFYDDAMNNMSNKPIEERLVVKDTVLGNRDDNAFKINGMTFGAVTMGNQIVFPLVVKPCEKLDAKVRKTLERLADEVKKIRGHYRFYSYTDARVALNPAYWGPPIFEMEDSDPHSNCTGAPLVVPTRTTIPIVCSTLIWAAAMRINAANPGGAPIELHGVQDDNEVAHLCHEKRAYTPPSDRDLITPQTPDGLYFYLRDQRGVAAKELYKHNSETVASVVLQNADLWAQVKPHIPPDVPIGTLWDTAKLITLLGYPTVRALLDISDDILAKLVTLMSDMPADVANQLCNAFAWDDCTRGAKDSTAWKDDPGLGTTVSPDNIVRSWSLPVEGTNGLYGFNEKLELVPPTWWINPPPDTSWQISQGFRRGYVRVIIESTPNGFSYGVEGAIIRIGGHPAFPSGPDGWVREVDLPEGIYWCDAHWRHPDLSLTLESKGQLERISLDGQSPEIVIQLQLPQKTRRRVWFSGQAHLINRHAGAEIPLLNLVINDWEETKNIDHRYISDADMDVLGFGFPEVDPLFTDTIANARNTTRMLRQKIEDWGYAVVNFALGIQNDGSIKVSVKAGMQKIDEDVEWITDHITEIPTDEYRQIQISLRKDIWPARADISIDIHNSQI